MPDIIGFLKSTFTGELPFHDFVGALGQIFNDIGIGGAVSSLTEKFWFPYAAIALGLVVLCYGKKWLGFLKFIASAGGGFAIGLAINPMLIPTLPVLEGKAWITGAVFALVLGVLSGLLYFVLYIGGSGLFVYVTCYAGGLFPFPLPTEKSVVLSCIAVAVVAFMLLVWRKNSEMLGTAFLGAFLINKGIRIIYDYTALLAEHADVLNAVVLCMIAVLGFTHQYRRRRRYY